MHYLICDFHCLFCQLLALQVPLVKLDDKYFKLVDQMERLAPRAPSLVGASSLTVKVGACGRIDDE